MITTSLIYRKIAGRLSAKEEKAFEYWLGESEEHVLFYERMRELFIREPGREALSEEEVERAWRAYKTIMENVRRQKRRRCDLLAWKVAASVAVIVTAGFFLYLSNYVEKRATTVTQELPQSKHAAVLELANGSVHYLERKDYDIREEAGKRISVDTSGVSYAGGDMLHQEGENVAYNKLSVPRGCEYKIELEDGTVVWVNSDSQLEYPVVFSKGRREVTLRGEAYFEVKRDTARPFVVRTGTQNITVLGTSFGVTAFGEEMYEYTTLVSGRVRVSSDEGKECVVLEPGMQAYYDKSRRKMEAREVNVAEFVSWKDGKYMFWRKRLEEVLNTLARWYDFEVFYQNQDMKDIVLSGEVERFEDFNCLLRLLEEVSDVKFSVSGRVVQVMRK